LGCGAEGLPFEVLFDQGITLSNRKASKDVGKSLGGVSSAPSGQILSFSEG